MASVRETLESMVGTLYFPSFDSWHVRLPLFYSSLWAILEVIASRIWPIRQSCKKISLLHCVLAFILSSVWLAYHFVKSGFNFSDYELTGYEYPGTFEHHIICISMSYFIVDMPFAIAFHKTFIVHHSLCILAFMAIQGYMRYWPLNMDFMTWNTAPRVAPSHVKQYMLGIFGQDPMESDKQMQFLLGGFNGVFNLWMAELGGMFFHINRAFQGTEWEVPSRGVFIVMFTFSRCYLWPLYIRNLYKDSMNKVSFYHMVGALLETGLFITNLHFLYKNLAPIWKSGRLMPTKPKYYHREWLNKHPSLYKAASFIVSQDKIDLSRRSSYTSSTKSMEEEDSKLMGSGSIRSGTRGKRGTKKEN